MWFTWDFFGGERIYSRKKTRQISFVAEAVPTGPSSGLLKWYGNQILQYFLPETLFMNLDPEAEYVQRAPDCFRW